MKDTINLIRVDGTSVDATLICYFENVNDKRQYVYYTLNEISGTDANSTVKVYCAKMRQNDPALDTPISESAWEQLKGHMAEALKATLNPNIKFLQISSLADKTIVSEKVIAMPVSYDYINKHYQFYIDNISSDESATIEPVVAPIVEEVQPIPTESVNEIPQETVVEQTIETPAPVMPEEVPSTNEVTPIDIASIEEKYAKMIEDINKLRDLELEAAKRYNATIELSSMHNEQHASYVQSEQIKENPVPVQPVPFEPTPVEPTPIEPIVQAPVQSETAQPQDIETNWFDMPIQ